MPATYWFAGEAGGGLPETVHRDRDCGDLYYDGDKERRPVSESVVGDDVELCPSCFPDGGDGAAASGSGDRATIDWYDGGEEVIRDAVAFEPGDHTVSEIRDLVEDVDNPDEVAAIRALEREGEKRSTAIDALEDRIDELEG